MSASVRCSALPVRQLSGSSASVRLRDRRTRTRSLRGRVRQRRTPRNGDLMTEAHRVRSSVDVSGFTARCSCGWLVVTSTRGERDQAVDQHHGLPRSRGSHGLVTEGD